MKKISLIALVSLYSFSYSFSQIKPFKSGDRIAFVGNSITEAGFYESDVWLYYMTHFPSQKITVYNVGIGGDVSGQMNDRFEDDVLKVKPNKMFLTFGMNDTGYFEFLKQDAEKTAQERIEKSFKSFGLLQEKMKAHPEIEKNIMSSSPYDEAMKNKDNLFPGKSKAMEKIVQFQKEAAEKNNWGYVDLFHPMTEINLRGQKTKPEFTLTGPDRIHPGKGGHLVMASLILSAQGLNDKPIADVTIDAKKKNVIKSENAKTDQLVVSGNKVSFGYLASSLPFPVDSVSSTWGNPQKQSEALAVYPFIRNFNQEIITVKGLAKGSYSLVIDGQKIHVFPSDSLEKGVNLALLSNTPQYQQSLEIMHLNDLRAELEGKLRQYYWIQFNFFRAAGLLFDDSEKAVEAAREKAKTDGFVRSKMDTYETARFPEIRKMWQADMNTIVEKIYSINRPEKHQIEIVPLVKTSKL